MAANAGKKRKAVDDLATNEDGSNAVKRKKETLIASSNEKKHAGGVASTSPKVAAIKRKNSVIAATASSSTKQEQLLHSAGHSWSSPDHYHSGTTSASVVSRGRQKLSESATNPAAFINNGSVSAFSLLKNHPVSASMNITDETTVKDILSLLSSAKQHQRQQSPDKLSGSATPPSGAVSSPKKRPNILARGLKPPALYGIGEIVAAALGGGDEPDLLKIEEPICVEIPALIDSGENGRLSKSPKSKKSPKIVNGNVPKSSLLRKSGPLSPKAGSKSKLVNNGQPNGSTSPKSSPISDVTKLAIANAVAKLSASQTRLLEKHRLSGDSPPTGAASYRNASLLSLLSSNCSTKSKSAAAFTEQKSATLSTGNEVSKSFATIERKPAVMPPPMVSHTCHTCGKNIDHHLLVHCVTCKFHYHVGCLDPPLAKPPANHKNFAFECADCAFPSSTSSSSASEGEEEKIKKKKTTYADNDDVVTSDEPLATRRQRRSTAASAVVALSHLIASDRLSSDDVRRLPSSKRSNGRGKRGGACGKKKMKRDAFCFEGKEVAVDCFRGRDATALSSSVADALNSLSNAGPSTENEQFSKTIAST